MRLIPKECPNCLSDLIGFDSCEAPTQCLQLTSLGGISEDLLASISDPSKHNNIFDVFDDAKKNAYLNFREDLLNQFGKVGSYGSELLHSEDISLRKPRHIYTKVKNFVGQIIYFDKAQLQVLNLRTIKFYSEGAGTIDVKVIDINSQVTLLSMVSLPVIQGLNIIPINETFEVQTNGEVLIIQVEPSASLTGKLYLSTCGEYSIGCGCKCSTIQETTQDVIEYDSILDIINNTYRQAVGFFCADYSIECDIDKMICENTKHLGYAYMLKTYIELINIQITSPRINVLSESNLEAIKAVILPQKVKEYHSAISRAVRNMLTTKLEASACFSCVVEVDSAVRIVTRN